MERLPRVFQVYILAMISVVSGALWMGAPSISWDRWPEMLVFTVLIASAAMFPIPNPRGGYITSATTIFYVLLCVHNPQTALLVSAVGFGLGATVSRGWVPWRMLFNGAQMGLSVALAGVAFRLSGGSLENPGVLTLLVPLMVASFVHQASNNLFIAWFLAWLRNTPWLRSWIVEVKDYLWSNLLTVPTAALLSILYVSVHPLTLLLYLASLPVQRWAIQLYLRHRQIFDQAIDSLVVAIDANFPRGKGHSRRVADLAVATAKRMGLTDSVIDGIELGALIHDVGMIGFEELIASSDDNAVSRLREHVRVGAEVAREMPRREVSEIVLYHHEHFDGTGYLGLKGNRIPVGARIVALAEAFESSIEPAPSGAQTLTIRDALKAIESQAGKEFDPRVVTAFLEVARSEPDVLVGVPNQLTAQVVPARGSGS